eukprot:5156229-Prymnesium_polylepis.1
MPTTTRPQADGRTVTCERYIAHRYTAPGPDLVTIRSAPLTAIPVSAGELLLGHEPPTTATGVGPHKRCGTHRVSTVSASQARSRTSCRAVCAPHAATATCSCNPVVSQFYVACL